MPGRNPRRRWCHSHSPGDGGRHVVDVGLPGDSPGDIDRIDEVLGLGAGRVPVRQLQHLWRWRNRHGCRASDAHGVATGTVQQDLADTVPGARRQVEPPTEDIQPPANGAHGQVQVLSVRAHEPTRPRTHRDGEGARQPGRLARHDPHVVLGEMLEHVDGHESVERFFDRAERERIAEDLPFDRNAVEGGRRHFDRRDPGAVVLEIAGELAVAGAEFEHRLTRHRQLQLREQRQAFVHVVLGVFRVAVVVETRVVERRAVQGDAGQLEQPRGLGPRVRRVQHHPGIPVVSRREAVEAETVGFESQVRNQRGQREAGRRLRHVRQEGVHVGGGVQYRHGAPPSEIGQVRRFDGIDRERRHRDLAITHIQVGPAIQGAHAGAGAHETFEARHPEVVEADDGGISIDDRAELPPRMSISHQRDGLTKGKEQRFS